MNKATPSERIFFKERCHYSNEILISPLTHTIALRVVRRCVLLAHPKSRRSLREGSRWPELGEDVRYQGLGDGPSCHVRYWYWHWYCN